MHDAPKPAPPGMLREGVARIIDPEAWMFADEVRAVQVHTDLIGVDDWEAAAARRTAPSLAKADAILALARPASSAGGVEEALERALKEAEERTANYAENIARLYKALHNASTWIGEIISNAKAEAATIGVIPTDERLGWERTEALRRSIRYALRRAALTSKGADRG